MRNRPSPLLAELHAHTTWSDGELSVPEIVDLYGSRGFDVLCITDHVVRCDDPWLDPVEWRDRGVRPAVYSRYRAEIEREARRARRRYDMLLLPGLELTYNDLDPDRQRTPSPSDCASSSLSTRESLTPSGRHGPTAQQ